jgi:hypothetical protein
MGLGSGIRDPGSGKTYSVLIQGSKRHRIPDPDPQHWVLVSLVSIAASFLGADTYGISVRVLTNNRDNVTSCFCGHINDRDTGTSNFLQFFMEKNYIFEDIAMKD